MNENVLTADGAEWMIDAIGCLPESLRNSQRLYKFMNTIIHELKLNPIGQPLWHVFEHEGGITGMFLLSESHLTVHTFPEFGLATFNLYCCCPRPEWNWSERLCLELGARNVSVRYFVRGPSALEQSKNSPNTNLMQKG